MKGHWEDAVIETSYREQEDPEKISEAIKRALNDAEITPGMNPTVIPIMTRRVGQLDDENRDENRVVTHFSVQFFVKDSDQ